MVIFFICLASFLGPSDKKNLRKTSWGQFVLRLTWAWSKQKPKGFGTDDSKLEFKKMKLEGSIT